MGSASWVKSRLTGLGINAKISEKEVEIDGEKIIGRIVLIPATEVQALSARFSSLDRAQMEILGELKLFGTRGRGQSR